MNLLPVQHKRSRHPGDSKAMIVARTDFLNTGVYQPIARQLIELVLSYLAQTTLQQRPELCLLDAGCGEGYYLDHLAQALRTHDAPQTLSLLGIDISKPAILAAARRNKQISWLVASNKNPPLQPGSLDVIICLFGFPDFQQFKKLLRPGGLLILADPGPQHLIELREIIYPTVKKGALPDLGPAIDAGFSLGNNPDIADSTSVTYQTAELSQTDIMNLLTMTPHLYKASYEGKQAVQALPGMQLSVDVVFRCLTATP